MFTIRCPGLKALVLGALIVYSDDERPTALKMDAGSP